MEGNFTSAGYMEIEFQISTGTLLLPNAIFSSERLFFDFRASEKSKTLDSPEPQDASEHQPNNT